MTSPRTPTGAIVIGRDYGALGVVRSLGRRDIPVWLLEEAVSNVSVSRYLAGRLPWPAGEAAQLALLAELADRRGLAGWTIYPASDESAALVARHHAELSRRFVLTSPPWSAMRWAYDKRLTHELAAELGVAAPLTFTPRDRAELAQRAGAPDFRFPVIVKPATKPETNDLTAAKAWRAHDLAELLRRYDEACALVDPATLLIQELIPGGGREQLSYVALVEEGRPLAWLTARRTRQYPIDFGKYSTCVETIADPGVIEPAERLLAAMRYTGLVEVEFKRSEAGGPPLVIDINARTWAWHSLCGRAGVDFPYLQWLHVHGEPLPVTRAKAGVRWMRGLTDLPAAVRLMRARQLSPLGYLAGFRPPVEFALFALDDPLPWVADVPLMAARHWGRRHTPAASAPEPSPAR